MVWHSGIGRFIRLLLLGLRSLTNAESLDFLLLGDPKIKENLPLPKNCHLIDFQSPIYSVKEQVLFPKDALDGVTLLHSPHYNIPLRWRGRLVVNIHDLNHLIFEKIWRSPHRWLYARFFYKQATIRSDAIIVPSEFVANQLKDFLRCPPEKIHIVPYAIDPIFKPAEPEEIKAYLRRRQIPEDYLLCVGINKFHKNYHFVVQSLLEEWENSSDIPPPGLCRFLNKKRTELICLYKTPFLGKESSHTGQSS